MGKLAAERKPLCIADASTLIGVCRNTLLGWTAAGHVAGAYKTHGNRGHWRFAKPEFLEWLARYQSGEVIIPRKRKTARRPPTKGGLKARLREVSLCGQPSLTT